MIVKELDAFAIVNGDTLARAGRKAEENLAHYLNRAFKGSPDFLVFNGIRLEKNSDAAQMDHLILHRYGLIIVESKSVASRVRINEHEEWARFWNGDWRGMPSPIKQAERQGEFLRDIIQEHREQLRNKMLFGLKQGGFLTMPIDVLVSISDSSLIDRPRGKNALPEVCKADQVADRIQELHARYKKMEGGLLGIPRDPPYTLSRDEIERLSSFLIQRHQPLIQAASCRETGNFDCDAPVQLAVPITLIIEKHFQVLQCRHCNADQIDIVHGRYGYYVKCLVCDKNTPLNRLCRKCGSKEKIRKDGRKFFAECAACTTSHAFHENAHR